jgi:hypothetical protein
MPLVGIGSPYSGADLKALIVSAIVFARVFGGALVGMYLRVPERHIGAEAKDVVKLGMGLFGGKRGTCS